MSGPNDEPTVPHGQGAPDDATVLRALSESVPGTGLTIASGGEAIRTQSSSWTSGLAADGDAYAPRVLKQRFVLEDRIGSGGMGTVFRARDQRKVEARDTQPFVAIKVLNNDFRQHPEAFVALEREASKSQALRHPNIVSIFDFDKDGDVPFMTMELLEGAELADLLRRYPSGLPRDMAWPVIRGMVAGLQHAHHEGVVHADFKPGNVFVTDRKTAKVLDFGIARAIRSHKLGDGGAKDHTHFDVGRIAALTPAYASREMLTGDNPEPRDDLYALGVVIYMVLTGRHPFGRLPASEAAQEGQQPERIKEISRRQWRTIQACLAFSRQQRPRSADEVFAGLFQKPAWQNHSVAAGVAAVAAGVLLLGLVESTELNEVKDEVRQETLLETQLGRVREQLVVAEASERWAETLFEELDNLRALAPPETVAEVTADVDAVLAALIADSPTTRDARLVYQQSLRFGEAHATYGAYVERLVEALDALVALPFDGAWLADATEVLAWARELTPPSSRLEAVREGTAETIGARIVTELLPGQRELAAAVWELMAPAVFDADTWDLAGAGVADAHARARAREAQAEAKVRAAALTEALNGLVGGSCLRVDLDAVGTWFAKLEGADRAHKAALERHALARLEGCVARLSALEPTRAQRFAEDLQRQFHAPVAGFSGLDPCAAHYLVGDAAQGGSRPGTCTDVLPDAEQGPELVVLPGSGSGERFAISRYEISWDDFDKFCSQSGVCETRGPAGLPVAGVPVATVEAYAKWLSERTGYRYRLPTLDEWQRASSGQPDPNRNCRVDVGGVRRGSSPVGVASGSANAQGLFNVLGNVREIVTADGSYAVAGGGFADPIDVCLSSSARPLEEVVDVATGFRLVREIS